MINFKLITISENLIRRVFYIILNIAIWFLIKLHTENLIPEPRNTDYISNLFSTPNYTMHEVHLILTIMIIFISMLICFNNFDFIIEALQYFTISISIILIDSIFFNFIIEENTFFPIAMHFVIIAFFGLLSLFLLYVDTKIEIIMTFLFFLPLHFITGYGIIPPLVASVVISKYINSKFNTKLLSRIETPEQGYLKTNKKLKLQLKYYKKENRRLNKNLIREKSKNKIKK